MDTKKLNQKPVTHLQARERDLTAMRESLDSLFHKYQKTYGAEATFDLLVAFVPECDNFLTDLAQELRFKIAESSVSNSLKFRSAK